MVQARTIRVLIADDHDMLRSGLAVFIETCHDIKLVGEAANGLEAIEVCSQVQPDVILMDLLMPEMDGITATRLIRQQFPNIKVVALTSYTDEALVQAALNAGVISYLVKSISIDALGDAIRDAYAGKATLAREATQALVNAAQRPPAPIYRLSKREHEVLTLIVQGKSNREIAHCLTVGVSTVKKHVSNILTKLNTNSRTEAVAIAVRHNLVNHTS